MNIIPLNLTGKIVTLEPLAETHFKELNAAAQDEKIWEFHADKAYGEKLSIWFNKAIENFKKGEHLPFAVRAIANNKIIGSTRFYDIKQKYLKLSIGNTWYLPDVWGSSVNTECKYLLLKYAFEVLQMNRVEFITDVKNIRSRKALTKLGATQEGILRHHLTLENGYIRNSVMFSIIKPEWENVKPSIEQRLL